MCTVLFGWRVWPGVDVLLAANRDERLDRPAEPPRGRLVAGTRVFCPLDQEAGGSWLGVNERGLVVALTNRYGGASDGARRSRGGIVMAALQAASASAAADALRATQASDYSGFHCLVADGDTGWLVRSDGASVVTEPLQPGRLEVVTERSFGAGASGRVAFLGARAPALEAAPEPPVEALAALLATHARASLAADDRPQDDDLPAHPMDGVCVHLDGLNYGTRSAELVSIASDRRRSTWLHAGGAPCRATLEPLDLQLREALKW